VLPLDNKVALTGVPCRNCRAVVTEAGLKDVFKLLIYKSKRQIYPLTNGTPGFTDLVEPVVLRGTGHNQQRTMTQVHCQG
jgi:hypothetical protein